MVRPVIEGVSVIGQAVYLSAQNQAITLNAIGAALVTPVQSGNQKLIHFWFWHAKEQVKTATTGGGARKRESSW
ncbi:MAG: hypothetical protein NVS9B13_26160 [Candidatus Acidiferrum sp.]